MMPSLTNAGRSRGDGAHGVRVRLIVLQVLVLSLIVTLFGRLWYLQIRQGDEFAKAATSNNVRNVVTPAVRGSILDDKGRPLVNNHTALVVSVSRTELETQADKGAKVLERLAGVLGMKPEDLKLKTRLCERNVPQPCWNGSPYQPIPVSQNATTEQALSIMEHREDFPGVNAEPAAVRGYPAPEGVNAASTLGYLSPVSDEELTKQKAAGKNDLQRSDQVGRSGLERTYDTDLRGKTGVTQLAVDNLGRVTGTVSETPATPGNHLVTSIDARIQAVAEQQLQEAILRARSTYDAGNTHKNFVADGGAVVVLDVKTGRVVAMASAPSYDPNVWVGGISKQNYETLTSPDSGMPLVPRAIQGQFAPGSIFKVISTSAAAENGYSLKANYPCPSGITVGGITFNNLESASYGDISLQRALEVSCNSVFYGLSYDMWLKQGGLKGTHHPMVDMARAYGLGSPTGIDIPGEVPGRIVDQGVRRAEWEKNKDTWCRLSNDPKTPSQEKIVYHENCLDGWQFRAGDAVNFAIGQGETLVTPLQMARVYAAIANGGTLWEPTIGKAIVTPDGKLVREIQPKEAGKLPVSPATMAYLQTALKSVSVNGTAARVFAGWPMDKLPIGAKTGTGSVQNKQSTSWFATEGGPADGPQYAIVMMVSQGGTGSGTSGPSVRKIYEALFGVDDKGQIDPSKAMLPAPPTALPQIKADGMVVPAASFTFDAPRPPAPDGGPGTSVVAAAPGAQPPERVAYRGGRFV
ncbi:penicillin-binding protein 2 [Yinghuangia seranimata]|uniref:penicillin-binding protein 2 n=1 Tax=Yinghuangia seranimata TaxID=408067 RepID=UPI00248CC3F2|nr:penicillin-binding protein 2 [Yinghuangia seranimata]MDI2127378.1 penicillin-binding protein 2 [Yinghuangia seranimata]